MHKLFCILLPLLCLAWRFPDAPVRPRWVLLAPAARVTWYGPPKFVAGMPTASGEPFVLDAPACALGPALLAQARAATGLRWGMLVRIEPLGVKYQGSAVFRVVDTGSEALEVDLPLATWQRMAGHPAGGVFLARIAILQEAE